MLEHSPLKNILRSSERVKLFYTIPFTHLIDSREQSLKTFVFMEHAKNYIGEYILEDMNIEYKSFRNDYKVLMGMIGKLIKLDPELIRSALWIRRTFNAVKPITEISSELMLLRTKAILCDIEYIGKDRDMLLKMLVHIDSMSSYRNLTDCPELIDVMAHTNSPSTLVHYMAKYFPETVMSIGKFEFEQKLNQTPPTLIK